MKSKVLLMMAIDFLIASYAFSQTLGNQFEQTVSVASVTAYSTSHVVVEYNVPSNATGLIVRFATVSKGKSFTEPSLSSVLSLLPKSELTQAISLAKFALGNSDDNSINFKVLTTSSDANAFTNTNFYHYSAMRFTNTVSSCFYLDDCLNNRLYFAIENSNYFKGVNVKVEIIPVYANSPHTYTLQLHNTADKEMKFEIQYDDDPTWYSKSIDADCYVNYIVRTSRVRLRVATNGTYKTRIADTYERQWLKWDETNKIWDFIYTKEGDLY